MNVTERCPQKSTEIGMLINRNAHPALFDGIFGVEVIKKIESFYLTNHLLMKEAERRGWKTKILNHEKNLIAVLPPNSDRSILFRRTLTELNTALGKWIADDKISTYTIATCAGILMPASLQLTLNSQGFTAELLEFLRTHGHIVVKPIDCGLGNGVSTNVTDESSLHAAIEYAKQFSKNIMVQRYVAGGDYRLLVLNGHVIAAVRRCPPSVIGDGINTVQQLIDIENAQQSRGSARFKPLRPISSNLVQDHLGIGRMNSVPEPGQKVQLLGVANIARGGTSCDVTQSIHPSIYRMAEKMVDVAYLSLCGVDMIIDGDASKPVGSGCQPLILEINTAPDISLHHFPAGGGHARNVSAAILDEIIRHRAVARKISSAENVLTSPNNYLTCQNDVGEHFAEIIPDPGVFFPLSIGEIDFYAKDGVHQ